MSEDGAEPFMFYNTISKEKFHGHVPKKVSSSTADSVGAVTIVYGATINYTEDYFDVTH